MNSESSHRTIDNPFTPDLPARPGTEFFGREDVIESIYNDLAADQASTVAPGDRPLVICGPNAIGKTSLLFRLADDGLDAQGAVLYADFGVMDTSNFSVFLWQLAKAIMNAMRHAGLATPQIEKRMLILNPQLVFRQRFWNPLLSKAHSTRLLLAWDNFDALLMQGRANHNLPLLRAYLYELLQTEAPIDLLLTVTGRVEALGEDALSPFLLARNHRLTNLNRAQTLRLVRKSERMTVFESVAEFIFQLTAGHPGDTQKLCQLLYDRHVTRGHMQVTIADVIAVLQHDLKPANFVGKVYQRLDRSATSAG